jgi:NAD(P)-dependent dehydrogenase (short-subunit alcohol dehydrogenase family)
MTASAMRVRDEGRTAADELFSVAGKVVLVTGGGRGIGYMIAEGFARAGARVYIASRKAQACEEAAARLTEVGEVHSLAADVADEAQCRALMDAVAERETGLHVLVNNAGATWGESLERFSDRGWDKILAVNLKAPFHLARFALPLLRGAATDDDPARIINIGSIDGLLVPIFDNYSYGASKAGLHQLTRHLARTLSPDVLVNAIAPGPFETKMMEGPLREQGERIRKLSPLGRIGRPSDIAGAAVFLASRASSFITGAVFPVDGGITTTAAAGGQGEEP